MKDVWFSGMGSLFPVHDVWVTDNQGAIQERTNEILGYTDKAIVAARLLLLRVIKNLQKGKEPPHVLRESKANDFRHLVVLSEVVPDREDWRTYWTRRINGDAQVNHQAVSQVGL